MIQAPGAARRRDNDSFEGDQLVADLHRIAAVVNDASQRKVRLRHYDAQLGDEEYLVGQNRETQTKLFVDSLKAKGKVEIFI